MRFIDLRDPSRDRARIDRELDPFPERLNGLVRNRIPQAKVIDDDLHDADPIASSVVKFVGRPRVESDEQVLRGGTPENAERSRAGKAGSANAPTATAKTPLVRRWQARSGMPGPHLPDSSERLNDLTVRARSLRASSAATGFINRIKPKSSPCAV